MLIRNLMTPKPQTLQLTDTLKDAAFLFYKYKISGAPVINSEGKLCGLITRNHIIKAAVNKISLSQPVSSVMTSSVITIKPENTTEEAWQIPVGHLPVVDDEHKVVGILSKKDFFQFFHQKLCRSNNIVKTLIQSAQSGVIMINAYGIIKVFNEIAEQITGISAQKAEGKFINDIFCDNELLDIIRTGKPNLGGQLTLNNQNILVNRAPIFQNSKIVGALAILQNISPMLTTKNELTALQNKVKALECIFENLGQGIIVVDENNTITLANPSYENIMGIPREELIGSNAKDVIENSRMHIILKTGVPELAELQRVKGRQVVVNRVPIFNNGYIIGGIGEAIFKDVSELSMILRKEKGFDISASASPLPAQLKSTGTVFEKIIGRTRSIVQAKNLAAKAALTDSTVLIIGESGTGKDLFAQAIHELSKRRTRPLISINCAAIPTELLEAELFGYDEGAFTGAKKGGKKGQFELANGGTLFLDEIGDMPMLMQAKLLRVMQNKTFEHVGGEKQLSCDVRIIAATNKPLEVMIKDHTFREDLYYRLNVISLKIPPLRDRLEDVGDLINHLLPQICNRLGVSVKQISPEALSLLRKYSWPGNIRELINVLEQISATVSCPYIAPKYLPPTILYHHNSPDISQGPEISLDNPSEKISELEEKQAIEKTLKESNGNKALAAKLLGIHRSTLYVKIKKYNIEC